MKHAQPTVRFFSLRTLWGLLAGVIIALVFVIFFRQPFLYTPVISIMIAVWISKLSDPKHFAVVGAIIAIPVGLVAGVQFALGMSGVGLGHLIGMYVGASIFFAISMLWFAFPGFFLGQVLRLYRRGALF